MFFITDFFREHRPAHADAAIPFSPNRRHEPTAEHELIHWSADFSVDNGLIDEEHKQILRLLNIIYDDWSSGARALKLTPIIEKMSALLAIHFANEEAVLSEHNCPSLSAHKMEHRRLMGEYDLRVDELKNETLEEEALALFLKHIFVDHVLGYDLEMKKYLHH